MRVFDLTRPGMVFIKEMFVDCLHDGLSSRRMMEVIGQAYFDLYVSKDLHVHADPKMRYQKIGNYILMTMLSMQFDVAKSDLVNHIHLSRRLTEKETNEVLHHSAEHFASSLHAGTIIPSEGASFAAGASKFAAKVGVYSVRVEPLTNKDLNYVRTNFIACLNRLFRMPPASATIERKFNQFCHLLYLTARASDLIQGSDTMLKNVVNCVETGNLTTQRAILFYNEIRAVFSKFIKLDALDLDGEPTTRCSYYASK